jgi:hypothetical protein
MLLFALPVLVNSYSLVEFVSPSELTESLLTELMYNGSVVVVRGASSDWPLVGMSCEEIRRHPNMTGFHFERVYGDNDGSYVPLCPDCPEWERDRRSSLNFDSHGPQFAPLYWDAKGDRGAISVVKSLTSDWPFLSKRNRWWRDNTPELWVTPPAAGAKSHMDSHVQMTTVTQLAGRRRWRLSTPPPPAGPSGISRLTPQYMDKDNFEWNPTVEIFLNSGDVLLFPPGTIHDTLNLSGDQCAASLTVQLGHPLPVVHFRKFLPRILRIGDLKELWPIIVDLASFGFLTPRLSLDSPFFETTHPDIPPLPPLTDPTEFYRTVYSEYYTQSLPGPHGRRPVEEYAKFFDLNGDGHVTEDEFLTVGTDWMEEERRVMEEIEREWRFMRYFSDLLEQIQNRQEL